MKRFLSPMILLFCITGFGQVGINTTNPQETLDVNGTLKITNTSQPAVTASVLGGLDSNGVFREISLGSSLQLSNNNIRIGHSFGSISINADLTDTFHDVDLLIGSGQTNEGKSIIRITATKSGAPENIKITGFAAGYDGQQIRIYAQSGNVQLKFENVLSLPANQILPNGHDSMSQWEMMILVYDGLNAKWVIMDYH